MTVLECLTQVTPQIWNGRNTRYVTPLSMTIESFLQYQYKSKLQQRLPGPDQHYTQRSITRFTKSAISHTYIQEPMRLLMIGPEVNHRILYRDLVSHTRTPILILAKSVTHVENLIVSFICLLIKVARRNGTIWKVYRYLSKQVCQWYYYVRFLGQVFLSSQSHSRLALWSSQLIRSV